jgi:hypothetical protein
MIRDINFSYIPYMMHKDRAELLEEYKKINHSLQLEFSRDCRHIPFSVGMSLYITGYQWLSHKIGTKLGIIRSEEIITAPSSRK